jgi:predicted transcriptional regulator
MRRNKRARRMKVEYDNMAEPTGEPDLISLAAEIVSAFVANNAIKSEDVATLIRKTHGALAGLSAPSAPLMLSEPAHAPAVSVRKSLGSREHILSLIDGKPYRTLTRHLRKHGLTPAEYKARYGLPESYPLIAPAYSEARSAMAKRLGLGQLARDARASKAGAAAAKPSGTRRRGRPPKKART